MPSPKDIYVNCDELNNITKENKANWLKEIKQVAKEIKKNATVLQVGCMNGVRIIALLKERPDLQITGLDIEKEFLKMARKNFKKCQIKAKLIHGDITKSLKIKKFDYVICLNNTLGYIPEEERAIENMKNLGEKVIISVYGEKFTNELAKKYFQSINLELQKIKKNIFHTKEFVKVIFSSRRRHTRLVSDWSSDVCSSD